MTSQLLNPPKPPTLHETGCLLLASSGFYIRLHEDGSASLVDGIQDITLADFTSAEIEGIAYGINSKVETQDELDGRRRIRYAGLHRPGRQADGSNELPHIDQPILLQPHQDRSATRPT